MLGLKLNHVSKTGHWCLTSCLVPQVSWDPPPWPQLLQMSALPETSIVMSTWWRGTVTFDHLIVWSVLPQGWARWVVSRNFYVIFVMSADQSDPETSSSTAFMMGTSLPQWARAGWQHRLGTAPVYVCYGSFLKNLLLLQWRLFTMVYRPMVS